MNSIFASLYPAIDMLNGVIPPLPNIGASIKSIGKGFGEVVG